MVVPKRDQKYGAYWDRGIHPAEIELECIARDGQWTSGNGTVCGMGMVYHVMAFAKLAWPWIKWHRWNTDLILPTLCSASRVALYGPASAGKSFIAAVFALTLYFARPNETTVLVSSTTREELELRVWGEIKMLWRKAKEQIESLPGFLTDSRQMITTDGKDTEGRDVRNGVVGRPIKRGNTWDAVSPFIGIKNKYVIGIADECFPASTLIDTPLGQVKISDIKPGDEVISAAGPKKVLTTTMRFSEWLVTVKAKDGRSFTCTKHHPILTQNGWIKACELGQAHYMLGAHESLQILRQRNPGQEFLVSASTMLQQLLRSEMDALTARTYGQEEQEDIGVICGHAQTKAGHSSSGVYPNEGQEPTGLPRSERQAAGYTKEDWMEAASKGRKRNGADECRSVIDESFSRSQEQLPHQDGPTERQRLSDVLQGGLGVPGDNARSRSGRQFSPCDCSQVSGLEKGTVLSGAWVDSVEIQKRQDPDGNRICGHATAVFNLQIEGHPSYSVNGFVVHNCGVMPDGFLRAYANLMANPRFLGIAIGNLGDLNTPLAEAAEPKNGWDSLADSDVSRVYDTRWSDGKAIQLIGEDSPNLDYAEDEEPFAPLIGRRFLRECEESYGRDTPLYNMFAAGKIPRGTMENRVITKQMCLKFNAFEPIEWGHKPIIKLYGADISYSIDHGDRTVGLPLGFGEDSEGKMKLAPLERPLVYTPSDRATGSVEEQIATQMRAECERLQIPPEHVFYDGTGRSSFTAAVMRLWSTSVVPVEFGGTASKRPNFMGRKYSEDRNGKRKGDLLPCDEVLQWLVTELWFAVGYLISSDQMRGLSEEVAKEGYLRTWRIVPGNKQRVETKAEMKLRLGRSPDIFESLVCGVEGARRLGFPLGTFGPQRPKNRTWLRSMNRSYDEALKSQELEVAA